MEKVKKYMVNRINFYRQITISLIFLENPKNLSSSLIYLINNCPNYWYDLSSETDIQMWQKMCLFFLQNRPVCVGGGRSGHSAASKDYYGPHTKRNYFIIVH